MPFTVLSMFTVAGILCLGSLLQTIVGFGAGLLGIPLLLLAGFPPVQAVAVVTITSIIRHAERVHGHKEIVSVTRDNPRHRYTYRDAFQRSRQLARHQGSQVWNSRCLCLWCR